MAELALSTTYHNSRLHDGLHLPDSMPEPATVWHTSTQVGGNPVVVRPYTHIAYLGKQ